MKYEVTLDERTHVVDVQRTATGWTVSVDGAPPEPIQGRRSGPTSWALSRDGARRQIVDVALHGDAAFVLHHHHPYRGEAVDPRTRALDTAGAGAQGRVVTQMPGAVVRVLVAEGDEVHAGDVLIVVEAMKMENEFKAPFDGVVASVPVSAGQAIESGTLLVELTPHGG